VNPGEDSKLDDAEMRIKSPSCFGGIIDFDDFIETQPGGDAVSLNLRAGA